MTSSESAAVSADTYTLRLLVENSTDMLARHAPDGTYTYVSPACRELLGYEPEELVGHSPYDLFHPDDLTQIRQSHDAVLESPELSSVTYRIRHADGHYVWFETTSHTVRDLDTGDVVEIQTSSRDITARMEAEARLRQSERRFRLAMQHAPIGKALVDLDGTFLAVNTRLCELLGRSAEELLSLSFQEITHPDDLDADLRSMQQLLAGEISHYRMEKRYLRPEGTVVWALLAASLVRDDAGEPQTFIAQIVDITDRKRAEIDLARVNDELESFAAVAAHDLRAPLATLRGFLELLTTRYDGVFGDQDRQIVKTATNVAAQMTETVEALLTLARAQTHEQEPELVDVRDVLDEVIVVLGPELEAADGAVSVASMPDVWGDRTQLRLLFQNLLANAIKFRAPDRPLEVSVSAERTENRWRFTFQDNGRGFDPDDHDTMFEPFARTREGFNVGAVGIGLATCRRIVERHGGTIEAHATNPGSRFAFTLPAVVRAAV